MENVITVALLVGLIYCFLKFVELKAFPQEKEMRPLKYFVRDVVIVFVSAIIAAFIYFSMSYNISDFMNVITETKTINSSATQIFTDAPGF
jgi:uncharacterized protein YacL